ncbi:hypothetical protein [Mycobacterium sp.]|uniref:hypothetical protein n=1 Tax=Mycobacterium sp. TaxID=1785 RepID=UPI0028BEAFF8|nr:hypothetical protein [Mycobacterium sp.]
MSTAPHRKYDTMFTGESYGDGDIAFVCAAHHRSRVSVDHVVPDTTCAFVFPTSWGNDVTRQPRIQLCDLPVGKFYGSTRGTLRHLATTCQCAGFR